MATLSQEQMEKYGISASDATSANHDKGIVKVGDTFYEIDGFERQQKKGTDTDQGAVFSSSLEKDSGGKYKNFNTATDVEDALSLVAGVQTVTEGPKPDEGPLRYSPQLQAAMDRVSQWEDQRWSGQMSQEIYGGGDDPIRFDERPLGERGQDGPRNMTEGRFDDGSRQQKEAAQALSKDYIESIKRDISGTLSEDISV